jgi:hypothetical protein
VGANNVNLVPTTVSAHVYAPFPIAEAISVAAPQQFPSTRSPAAQATAETFDIMRDIVIKIMMYFLSIYFFKV